MNDVQAVMTILLVVYTVFTIPCLVAMYRYNGTFYFDIFENYETWDKLNWFAVIFFTLLINVFFAPYAVIYWAKRFFVFIFTVGRGG